MEGCCLGRAPVEDGAAPLARSVEHAHCPQAIGHLLREPALDPSSLRKLGGVEELAPQGREAAGLDLDQQVAANEIDDETADGLLEQVTGTAVPLLQLRVERALVERPDLHHNAPSAPPPPCLQPRLTPTSAAGTV